MRLAEDIERLIRNARIRLDPEVRKTSLEGLISELGKSEKVHLAVTQPNIWRTLLKCNTTVCAAAILMIAVTIGLYEFNVSIDGSSVAFAKTRKAIREIPWMHVVINQYGVERDSEREEWFSFQAQVSAFRSSSKVGFTDFRKQQSSWFDDASQIITVSHISEEHLGSLPDSPMSFTETILFSRSEEFAGLTCERKQHNGIDADVYEATIVKEPFSVQFTFVADGRSHLPIYCKTVRKDLDGTKKETTEAHFDYPLHGPMNIYDLDVPVTAQVLDIGPSSELQNTIEEYQSHRSESLGRYMAIVITGNDHSPSDILMIYKHGSLEKIEHRPLSNDRVLKESLSGWDNLSEGAVDDLFHRLVQRGNQHVSRIRLFDGEYCYTVNAKNMKMTKQYLPKYESVEDIVAIGWPREVIAERHRITQNTIVEDAFSKQNKLICIQQLNDGEVFQNEIVRLPSKYLFYVNPDQDYICQKYEYISRIEAPWQFNDAWLEGIDLSDANNYVISEFDVVIEIKEFAQTNNGKWYPTVVTERSLRRKPDGEESIQFLTRRIYLKTDLDFPDGIFDPEKLPR